MSKFISKNTHYGLRRVTVIAVYNSQQVVNFPQAYHAILPLKVFKRRKHAKKFARK